MSDTKPPPDNETLAELLEETNKLLVMACTTLQLISGALRERDDDTNVFPLHPPTPPAS